MYAASLITLVSQRTRYALQVVGNALAPAIIHGDIVTITPSLDRTPENVAPGSVALVALPNPQHPDMYDRSGLFTMNADGDLIAGDTTLERGSYMLLGTVTDVQFPADHLPA